MPPPGSETQEEDSPGKEDKATSEEEAATEEEAAAEGDTVAEEEALAEGDTVAEEESPTEEEPPTEEEGATEKEAATGDDSVSQVRRAPLAGLFLAGQAYQPGQAITREPLRTQVHENHPTDKPVFYLPSLTAVLLPFGVADNNLFRLALDGTAVVFRASPDYEAPSDTGNGGLVAEDGEYHIQLLGLDSNSRPVVLSLIVRVIDQPQEVAHILPAHIVSQADWHSWRLNDEAWSLEDWAIIYVEGTTTPAMPQNDPGESPSAAELIQLYPKAEVAKIISGTHWPMPTTGPLLLTWSLKVRGSGPGEFVSDRQIQKVRSLVERALLTFEQAADIKFFEVDEYNNGLNHISFDFASGSFGAWAFLPSRKSSVYIRHRTYHDVENTYSSTLHEIGHALGLKHPFAPLGLSWPSDPSVRYEPWSIMNYDHDLRKPTPFDVAALQYLYGAPGSNSGIARASSAHSAQSPANHRPTEFRISKTEMTLPFANYDDVVLATIHVVDDGLGMAVPVLIGNEARFRLERYHDHWRLLLRDGVLWRDRSINNDYDLETTIRLLANGAGSDITPDLRFTLTIEDIDTDQPFHIAVQRIRPVSENADTSSSINMARVVVFNKEGEHLVDEYNFQEGLEITIGGEDAALFEMSVKSRYPNYLHLRAGVTLDHETNPSLDVVIVVSGNGANLTRSVSIPVTDVPEPGDDGGGDIDAPLLTGVQMVGAQLGVSVAHNRQIVIENIEWTRQGADDVLSDIDMFRADATGTYQVVVTYWVRLTTTDDKQPSRTWTKTFSIAPLEGTEMASATAVQGPAFDLEEPHKPEQNDEAVTSSLPDIA